MMISIRKALDVVDPDGTDGIGAAVLVLSIVGFAGYQRAPTDDETAAALSLYQRKHGEPTKAKIIEHFAGLMDCELPLLLFVELLKTDEQR